MKKPLLPLFLAALAAAPAAAADVRDPVKSRMSPDGAVGVSTAPASGALPGSAFPAWTEIRGKVIGVNRTTGQVEIQEDGVNGTRQVTIANSVTIYDKKMSPVGIGAVKKGQTVTLRNTSPAAPEPVQVQP